MLSAINHGTLALSTYLARITVSRRQEKPIKKPSAAANQTFFPKDPNSVEPRIEDIDAALRMIEFTRDRIVSESVTAMIAQANITPQSIHRLL